MRRPTIFDTCGNGDTAQRDECPVQTKMDVQHPNNKLYLHARPRAADARMLRRAVRGGTVDMFTEGPHISRERVPRPAKYPAASVSTHTHIHTHILYIQTLAFAEATKT